MVNSQKKIKWLINVTEDAPPNSCKDVPFKAIIYHSPSPTPTLDF